MSERKRLFLERLEAKGEAEVREDWEAGRYGNDHIVWAKLWLAEKDQARAALVTAVQEELARSHAAAALDSAEASRVQAEEAKAANRLASDANDIARDANREAQSANNTAVAAMAVAIVSAAIMAVIAFVQAARS